MSDEVKKEAENEYDVVEKNIQLRKNKRRKKPPNLLLRIIIVLGVIIGLLVFLNSNFFNVDKIEVEGNSYFTDEQIISMAHAETGNNIIFHADKNEIKDYLENSPYIEDIKVSRKLPNTLKITISEREQTAAIVYGDEYEVIDKDGILLRETETEPKITILTGLTITKLTLNEKVKAKEKVALKNTLKMLTAMDSGDIYFIKIEMSDLFIRAYIYDSLVCTGTPDEIIDSIESGNLKEILETLFEKNINRGTITISEDGYASFSPDLS